MRVLYIGPLFPGSTALHRMQALEQLGCRVVAIDSRWPGSNYGDSSPLGRIYRKLLRSTDAIMDWRGIRRSLRRHQNNGTWNVLWVDKGKDLSPELLSRFKQSQPECRFVNYSPDDMFNPANSTDHFLRSIPLYDLMVTTKSYNVAELREAGARDVFFVGNAYEPSIHRPVELSDEEQARWGCEVCFVGSCEPDRQRSIEKLAASGISVGLFGPWEHVAENYPNVRCHTGFFADEAYAKALCAGKIGLGFLRKANRDLQTTRSIELPACGVFMLAERTDEHLALFEEGREAEFFASDEELVEKCRYYLNHENERAAIARDGRARCSRDGYSNAGRLRAVLERLQKIQKKKI